jgi:hypothetical protein
MFLTSLHRCSWREGQRETGDELARGRFQRDRGQRVAQVGLVETDRAQPARLRVEVELRERQLMGDGEEHERVGGRVPVLNDIRLVN